MHFIAPASPAQRFSEAAKAYIAWALADAQDPRRDCFAALSHLSTLYGLALELPELFAEGDATPPPKAEQSRAAAHFSKLPVGMYASCFNALVVPPEEPAIADLADDLSDIFADLWRGQALFEQGHIDAAVWEWRFNFWRHWGRHALGAMHALQLWLEEA